jgi:uncharacterized protein DUF4019
MVRTSLKSMFGWAALVSATLIAFASTPLAIAQSAATSASLQSARAFLTITDRDDGKASWDVAGKQFRDAITKEKWAQALHGVRAPLGAVASRTLESTQFMDAFPGAARNGNYAILTFRTRFAAREAMETVTLEREDDGLWVVIGYFIA